MTRLGLTGRVHSQRAYPDLIAIRAVVARTAYAQLRYNPWLLLAMVMALTLVFLTPPALALFAAGPRNGLAHSHGAPWGWRLCPPLQRFALHAVRGITLPAIAAGYLVFSLSSALAEWRGMGGFWKGEALSRD